MAGPREHPDIDKGYAWLVLFAVFMNHVIVDGLLFSFGIFKIEFDEYFQKGSAQTTLVGSISSAVCLITAPVASVLVNRFGCRPVAICGSLIATVGFATSAACTTLNSLMITYGVIAGIGLGLLYLPSVVAVTFYFEKRRALATGIAVCGSGIGCFIFAPLGNLLLSIYDWKNGILYVAAITLQGCVFGALLRPLVFKKVPPPVPLLRPYTALERGGGVAEGGGMNGRRAGGEANECNDKFLRLDSINEKPPFDRRDSTASRGSRGPDRQLSGDSSGGGGGLVTSSTRKRGLSVSSARSVEGASRARRTSGTFYPVNPNASEDAAAAAGVSDLQMSNQSAAEDERGGRGLRASRLQRFAHVTGVYLLADPMFLLPFLCNLVASVGLFVPFFYIVSKAQHLGVEKTLASYLLSVIGIANTVNRIFVGMLADMEHVSALLLHNIGLVGAGLLCIFSMFAVNFGLLCAYCVLFGLCYAAWMALTSVVLCELLGLDKLTHAFGLLTLARGLSTLIGPPLAGAVFDATQNYSNALHVGGVALLLGGLISSLLHLPVFQRQKYNKEDVDCAFCCSQPINDDD